MFKIKLTKNFSYSFKTVDELTEYKIRAAKLIVAEVSRDIRRKLIRDNDLPLDLLNSPKRLDIHLRLKTMKDAKENQYKDSCE